MNRLRSLLAWREARRQCFAVPRSLETLPAPPRTPGNKVQKYLLPGEGVTAPTWDRVAAGYQIEEERRKAAARRDRRPGPRGRRAPGPLTAGRWPPSPGPRPGRRRSRPGRTHSAPPVAGA